MLGSIVCVLVLAVSVMWVWLCATVVVVITTIVTVYSVQNYYIKYNGNDWERYVIGLLVKVLLQNRTHAVIKQICS
jgi:hypothetical protein